MKRFIRWIIVLSLLSAIPVWIESPKSVYASPSLYQIPCKVKQDGNWKAVKNARDFSTDQDLLNDINQYGRYGHGEGMVAIDLSNNTWNHGTRNYGICEDQIIRAARKGRVVYNDWANTGGGNSLYLDHGDGQYSIYVHMPAPAPVAIGQELEEGQAIGPMDESGNADGVHLHFGVVVGDPRYLNYTDDWLFKYPFNISPNPPNFVAPADGSTFNSLQAKLEWSETIDLDGGPQLPTYKVRLWKTDNSWAQETGWVSSLNYTFNLPSNRDGSYCWYVKSSDGAGESDWPSWWCFTIASSLGIYIDQPQPESHLKQHDNFTIYGYGFDMSAPSGTSVKQVHIYRDGKAGSGGVAIGGATYGIERPDVASVFGERYRYSGYRLTWNIGELSLGRHTLYVYFESTVKGWVYLTQVIYVLPRSTDCLIPVYRYRNERTAAHFYTKSFGELGMGRNGWVFEGYVGYVAKIATCYAPGAVPFYRLWSDALQRHMYTADTYEWNYLKNNGWRDEGIVGYLLPSPNAAYYTKDLYRLNKDSIKDHFFTDSKYERDYAIAHFGYTDEGIAGYLFGDQALSVTPTPTKTHTPTPVVVPFKGYDYNHDGKPDIYVVLRSTTNNVNTEAHVLNGADDFQTFLMHVATPLGQTGNDGSWIFLLADYNKDGKLDLYAIQRTGTVSGKADVSILNGADTFRSFLYRGSTSLAQTGNNGSWAFGLADYNSDGKPDLYALAKTNTTSGKTDITILSGADNFQTQLLKTATGLGQVGITNTYVFTIGDYNNDGKSDIYAIKKANGASGKTEVHILNGADNFQTFLLHKATALDPQGSDDGWAFNLGDHNGDGMLDLYGIFKKVPANNPTEVHVLNGADQFQTFLLHKTTVLGQTGSDCRWDFIAGSCSYTNPVTPTPTRTVTPTVSLTHTPTKTLTPTMTLTPTPTRTAIPTNVLTATRTNTAIATATMTSPRAAIATITATHTPTRIATRTATATITRTPTHLGGHNYQVHLPFVPR